MQVAREGMMTAPSFRQGWALVLGFGLALAWVFPAWAATAAGRPLVTVITTGGTIAQTVDPKTGLAVPSLGAEALLSAVPGLSDIAELKVVELMMIDSRDMQPAHWLQIAAAVRDAVADPATDGVVVVHGTDTMQDIGYFLQLTRSGQKPVVVTGSMRDASHPAPDGPRNLHDAVRQAADPDAAGRGVTLTLNGRIVTALRAGKHDAGNVDTFGDGVDSWIGTVEGNAVHWSARPDQRLVFPLPDALPQVPVVLDYPGSTGALLDAAAADPATRGIVVVGFGIGNVSHPMYEAIARARAKGLPVLVSSRVASGRLRPAYGGEGGGSSLQALGAILSPINDPWKARIALMLALAESPQAAPATLSARLMGQ